MDKVILGWDGTRQGIQYLIRRCRYSILKKLANPVVTIV